jgi:hypothetical protein
MLDRTKKLFDVPPSPSRIILTTGLLSARNDQNSFLFTKVDALANQIQDASFIVRLRKYVTFMKRATSHTRKRMISD